MAEPTTWTELQANIADWLDRDDLTSQIAEYIGYAERTFNRVLRLPEMEESATASSSEVTVTLPSDFLIMRSLYIDGTNELTMLRQVSLDRLRSTYRAEETGTPAFFALQSATELVLAPAPTSSITYVLNYYQKIPALGATQATNWLLTAHPDLYVAQTLVEAHLFLRDTEAAGVWSQKAQATIADLTTLGRRKAMAENRAGLRTDIQSGTPFNINTGV